MMRWLWVMTILASSPVTAAGDSFGPPKSIRQWADSLLDDGAVLVGTLANARHKEKTGEGQTDFLVETILRQGKVKPPAKIAFSHFLEIEDPKNPPRVLVFCDWHKEEYDPFRIIRLSGGAKSLAYIKKTLTLDPKKPIGLLSFCFGHLEDADPEIANDAFLEMRQASDRDILAAAHSFSSAKLRGWLTHPKTDRGKLSLYGQLLGACGKKEIAFLRDLLAKQDERYESATDGLLLGCIWAEPKEGWKLLHATLANRKKEFEQRYAALRVARHMRETQPTETRSNFVKAMRTGMRHPDMADLPIEYLRQTRIWDLTVEILKLDGCKKFAHPLIERAILRYALRCEPTKASKAFLDARRRVAKKKVEDAEEMLKLDAEQR